MSGLTNDERLALHRASQAAIAYRDGLRDRPVTPHVGLDAVAETFIHALSEDGQPADAVIDALQRDADPGINQMASPNFHGYVLGGSHPVGVAADFLVSAWGQNAGSAYETPAITGMERAVCDWTLDLLGLPDDCGVGIVTGATIANTQGVMAARNALLAKQGWDVEAKGLFGAPEIPVLIGDDAHSAPFAALRYAGFGADRCTRVGTDDQGRVRKDAFAEALETCPSPPLVILQAGQINTGAFDPFDALIPMVHAKGGWVHIDGAFGLWLATVPELADRTKGVQAADSWAVDLHKWLNAPFDAGLAIVRDPEPLMRAMSARGAYLPGETAFPEPSDFTLELSRRARGVPSYAILKHLGKSGVRELIARHCRLASTIAESLAAEPGIEILNDIHCNQIALTCGKTDAETEAVLSTVQKCGKVYPTHGVWAGKKIIRISVIGYAMQDSDADLVTDEILSAWRALNAKA